MLKINCIFFEVGRNVDEFVHMFELFFMKNRTHACQENLLKI